MSHKPLLFIGIGSSGLYVLEQVQNFYYENLGKNKPNYVEYLYIETNKDNEPGITALPNEIKRVYISLGDMKIMIKELKEQYAGISWLPPEEDILEAGMGAGGIPACGRLGLWGKNTDGNNLKNVIKSIQEMYFKVGGPGAKDSDGSTPAVYITGSVTGGTGSGIFVDMAFLVRRVIKGINELYSLILLPPDPDVLKGNEIIYSNTLGALKAIDYFNNSRTTYTAHDKEYEQHKEPPFDLTQFISQSYNKGLPQLSSLSALYKMAGLYLFLNIIGLRAKRYERLVDASGNMQIGKYGTFGLSGIQYPKSQIEEFLSLNLGKELLERWVDSTYFYQQNSKLPIDNARITKEINKQFSEILRTAFNSLNASGGFNIEQDINREIKAILKKEKGDPANHIYDLFSPSNMQGYYASINNNLQAGVSEIVSSINEKITSDFNQFENLYYAKTQLNAICDAIKNVLGYWKSLGISSHQNQWENFLGKQVEWVTGKTYKYLGEQSGVLRDRMLTVLDQLKMHLFVNKLFDVRDNILKGEIPLRTLQRNIEMPIMYNIDGMIRQIETSIGKRDDIEGKKKFKSLNKRKNEIASDMEDETIPILRIFPSGSFETEVKQSHERYLKNSNRRYPTKDILIGDSSLWDYLMNSENGIFKLHRKLYHDCILKFRIELHRQDSVIDYDVSKYVNQAPQEAKQYASKCIHYLLPIRDKTLERSQNIPKVVIGSDRTVIGKVISLLKNENFHEFDRDKDHILEIPDLKNVMVFYIEQGNFYPLKDIQYIREIEKVDSEYYKSRSGMTWKKWYTFRNPYLNTAKANSSEEINVPSASSIVNTENTITQSHETKINKKDDNPFE